MRLSKLYSFAVIVLLLAVLFAGLVSVVTGSNMSNGKLMWSYTTGGPVSSSPAVVNGVVYIGSSDGNIYALNATTGEKLWSYTTGGFVYSSPTVANGIVYVGSDDHNVYALNANTGGRWSWETRSRPEALCTPPPPSPTESST